MKRIKTYLVYKILREYASLFKSIIRATLWRMRHLPTVVKDHFCDKRLNVETTEFYRLRDDPSLHNDMRGYAPTPYDRAKNIIDRLQLQKDDVFVDFGCGKGRVIFLAAQQKLKKVIGVELDKKLADIAHKNALNLRLQNTPIEIVNADAATYPVRDATVFYLFDPFGYKTVIKVVENIKASLITYPRKIRIVYLNEALHWLVESQDWLELDGEINNNDDILVCSNKSYCSNLASLNL